MIWTKIKLFVNVNVLLVFFFLEFFCFIFFCIIALIFQD